MRAAVRIWLRIVGSEPALILALAVTTLTTVTVVTAGVRLYDRVSQDDLHQTLVDAEPEQRSIRVETDGRIGSGGPSDPFNQLERRAEVFHQTEMTDLVRSVVAGHEWVMQSPSFRVSSFPEGEDGPFTRTMRLRYQSGIEGQMTVVDGRRPQPRGTRPLLVGPDCPHDITAVAGFEETTEVACRIVDVPVYELVVTAETASDLMIELGDTIFLRPDPMNPRWAFVPGDQTNRFLLVEISGIIELTDLGEPYWFGDNSLHRPRITENPDFRFIFASGIMDAGSYRWLLRDVPIVHFDYTWRYFVDPDRVTTEQAPNLAVDVDKLGAVDAVVLTGFPTLVDGHLRQRSLAASLVATSVAGFLTVSILAGFVLASLAARRQISSMSLLINRGVRRRTILAVGWLHGLVAALPAAAAGLLVARWLEPRGRWPLAVSIAGLIAVAVAVVVVGAVRASSLVAADGTIANPQFADRSGTADDWFSDRWQTTGVRRMVRDVTIIGLAGAAIVLVRRRLEQGQAIVGSSGSLVQDLDGLVAALPSLVAIASGIVLLRLAGPLYRILAAGGSRSRGLALFVGLRRLINQDRATRTAMTVVLVAVAVTGLASTLVETVGGGQYEHSRQQAAADLVVRGPADGVPLPTPVVEFNPIDPVAVAQAVERPGTIVVQPLGAPPVYVVAIDSGPMARVQGDGVINPAALEALAAADDTVRGLPALVAGRWDADVRPVIDSILELQVGTARVATTVVGRVDRFPSTPPDHPIVVVDLERLREALGPAVPPITTLFVDLDGAVDASEVARSITNLAPGLRVVDRQEVLRSFGGDPFVRWTLLGLRLLGWLSLLTGVLALWAALAITAPERRRNTGLLSVMGLRPGQAVALSTIEQVVPFAMAAVAGVATAAGLIGLLGFGFDLGPFTGDLPAIPLRADLWSLAIPAAIIVMAAAGAVAFGEGRRRWRGTEPASAATVGVAARGGGP